MIYRLRFSKFSSEGGGIGFLWNIVSAEQIVEYYYPSDDNDFLLNISRQLEIKPINEARIKPT